MSPHDSLALVRTAYEAYNERDFARAAECYADSLELRSLATDDVYHGQEGYLQYARGWAAALPDSQLDIVRLEGGPEHVTVEYMAKGTHTGTLISSHGHIPPTWMQIELPCCDVLEVQEDKIVRVHAYYDSGTLLRQMGLLPNSPIHPADRRAPLELYALENDAPLQQRNKAVVQWFMQSVINQHDPEAAAEFCAPNLAWHGGPLGELRDLASFQQLLGTLLTSFPDLQVEIQDSVAEGDRVAARLSMHGTHEGDFQGIPPTGKRITLAGTNTYRVVDGKIVEEWWHHDLFSVMKQLDVMPAMVRLSSTGED